MIDYPHYVINHKETETNTNIYEKLYRSNDTNYYIWNYKQNVIDSSTNGIYRSLLLSHPNKVPLCISPKKSLNIKDFLIDNRVLTDDIIINEFIDGIMINLFYDNKTKNWEIATKNSVGDDSDNNKRSIYRTFLDVLRADEGIRSVNDVPLINNLLKQYSYSFVLREHADRNSLHLVAVFRIELDLVYIIPITVYSAWDAFKDITGIIEFPKQFIKADYNELVNDLLNAPEYASLQGLMLTNIKTGDKTKIISPEYNSVTHAKRMPPHTQYQYICLNRINKVDDYLKHFPTYQNDFLTMRRELKQFINRMHKSYMDYYINKQPYVFGVDISKYFNHIIQIHEQIYVPSLLTCTRIIITKQVVTNYLNTIDPHELLFLINNNYKDFMKYRLTMAIINASLPC
jgi:hypothetical protein